MHYVYSAYLDATTCSGLRFKFFSTPSITPLPPNHLLKRFRGDVYYEIKRLQELFSIMKREWWSPEIIYKKISEYIDQVENCEPDSPYYKTFKYVRKYK